MCEMRVVPGYEKKQRGCQYCLHSDMKRHAGQMRTFCPHSECPYDVLDKYETYERFMESEDSLIRVDEYFSTVAGCYELARQAHSPKRVFSDGDSKIGL